MQVFEEVCDLLKLRELFMVSLSTLLRTAAAALFVIIVVSIFVIANAAISAVFTFTFETLDHTA